MDLLFKTQAVELKSQRCLFSFNFLFFGRVLYSWLGTHTIVDTEVTARDQQVFWRGCWTRLQRTTQKTLLLKLNLLSIFTQIRDKYIQLSISVTWYFIMFLQYWILDKTMMEYSLTMYWIITVSQQKEMEIVHTFATQCKQRGWYNVNFELKCVFSSNFITLTNYM